MLTRAIPDLRRHLDPSVPAQHQREAPRRLSGRYRLGRVGGTVILNDASHPSRVATSMGRSSNSGPFCFTAPSRLARAPRDRPTSPHSRPCACSDCARRWRDRFSAPSPLPLWLSCSCSFWSTTLATSLQSARFSARCACLPQLNLYSQIPLVGTEPQYQRLQPYLSQRPAPTLDDS